MKARTKSMDLAMKQLSSFHDAKRREFRRLPYL
jgi:hypothetical protein